MPTGERYSAELIERRDLSARLALFRFRAAEHPTFTPGQFATIGIKVNENIIERPYSIVSSPLEPFLEFFIELVLEGDLTPRLARRFPTDQIRAEDYFQIGDSASPIYRADNKSPHELADIVI